MNRKSEPSRTPTPTPPEYPRPCPLQHKSAAVHILFHVLIQIINLIKPSSLPPFSHAQLQSSEQLLTQVEQLKRLHVLQDFEALNTELDQDVRALDAR